MFLKQLKKFNKKKLEWKDEENLILGKSDKNLFKKIYVKKLGKW